MEWVAIHREVIVQIALRKTLKGPCQRKGQEGVRGGWDICAKLTAPEAFSILNDQQRRRGHCGAVR